MKLSDLGTEFRVLAIALVDRLPVPPDYSAAHVHGFVKKAIKAKNDETIVLEVSSSLWGLDLGTLKRLAEKAEDLATFCRLCGEETLKRAAGKDGKAVE